MTTKTILIVDDERMTVQMLEDVLAQEGYHTLSASHGAAALVLLSTTPVDLILIDIMMPILDGLGFCRVVLADPTTHAIPLILMSASRDVHKQIDFPYAAFLAKPFEIEELLSLIEALIGGAGAA